MDIKRSVKIIIVLSMLSFTYSFTYYSIITKNKILMCYSICLILTVVIFCTLAIIYWICRYTVKKLWRRRCKKLPNEIRICLSPLNIKMGFYCVIVPSILFTILVIIPSFLIIINFPNLDHVNICKSILLLTISFLGAYIGPILVYILRCPIPFMKNVKNNGNKLEIKLFSPNDSEVEIIYDGEIKVDNYHEFVSCPLRFEGLPNKIKNLKIKAGYFKFGSCTIESRNCKFLFLRTRGFNLMYFPGVDKDKVLDIMDFFERLSMVSACLYYKKGCTTVPESAIEKIKSNGIKFENMKADPKIIYMNYIIDLYPMLPPFYAFVYSLATTVLIMFIIPHYTDFHSEVLLSAAAFVASTLIAFPVFSSKIKKYIANRFLPRDVRRGVVYEKLFDDLFGEGSDEEPKDKTKEYERLLVRIIVEEIVRILEEIEINEGS